MRYLPAAGYAAGMPGDQNCVRQKGGNLTASDPGQQQGFIPISGRVIASDPDQQRGSHAAATSVTIHYALPPGQRYLPIVLYEAVTMIKIGDHNGQHVYEPVNDFLNSGEWSALSPQHGFQRRVPWSLGPGAVESTCRGSDFGGQLLDCQSLIL